MGRVPSRNTRKVTADELSVRLGVLEDRIAGLLLALEVKVDKDIQSLKDDVKRLKVI